MGKQTAYGFLFFQNNFLNKKVSYSLESTLFNIFFNMRKNAEDALKLCNGDVNLAAGMLYSKTWVES